MLWNVIVILVFLVIVLLVIFLFNVVLYDLFVIVFIIVVFVIGRLFEVFFSYVIIGYSFSGWERFCKKEMICFVVVEFNWLSWE